MTGSYLGRVKAIQTWYGVVVWSGVLVGSFLANLMDAETVGHCDAIVMPETDLIASGHACC